MDIVGGCCGTTPAHLELVVKAVRALGAERRRRPRRAVDVSSGMKAVSLDLKPPPLIVGEEYGTRASTVMTLTAAGEAGFEERSRGPGGDLTGTVHERFVLEAVLAESR